MCFWWTRPGSAGRSRFSSPAAVARLGRPTPSSPTSRRPSGTSSSSAGQSSPAKSCRSSDAPMKRVTGYPDRWSVAPGETVRFMVSCLDGDRYEAQIVQLKQPDAGPLATPFAPMPVAAPCNGPHTGRRQTIPIGSLAVVPAHPAHAITGSFTIAAYVWPTTPSKGRQAIIGTWSEATQTGYGLEIDASGALTVRIGSG